MKHRILLADDEPLVLEVLKAALESRGYEVEAANSGAEALQKLEAATFRLVITDMKMETDSAGLAVSKSAKLQPYKPAVMILTAYPPVGSDWRDNGVDAILLKGGAIQDLFRQIDDCCNKSL